MSATRGMVAGFLGLTLLEAAVSSQQAAGRVGGLISLASKFVSRVVDPTVPLVPDLTNK